MHRYIILFLCAFAVLPAIAQNENKLSSVNLSVVFPSNVDGLNESQLSKLESKIIEIVTNNGVSADGYTQNFVIYPKLEIYDEKSSQGGMKSLTILNCNLSLFIKQVSTNIIFSTFSKTIQGSGYNKNEAVNSVISFIETGDPKLNDFVKAGKEKIIKYYQANCDIVLRKAESERNIKKLESSLAILLTIPEEASSCYDKAQAKAKTIFKELQKNNCGIYIQRARAASASKDFGTALEYLGMVDPGGPCASESKGLINSISSKVDQESKKQWDFLLKTYSDDVAIRKAQIQTMNTLALSWLRAQPNTATYITIIK